MNVTVVITILNEADTITDLLHGLAAQTFMPHQVIVVDGGSTDNTVQLIKAWQKKHQKLDLQLIEKSSNRSQGRNIGIAAARTNWIAITDAGCVPDETWLEELLFAAENTQADVVAGYYYARSRSSFEKAVVPFFLVMPDQVDPYTFLPATRSMLLKKSVWKELKGFDEKLTFSEDYVFAQRAAKKYKLAFTDRALVAWRPMSSLRAFFTAVQSQAKFDAVGHHIRLKVWAIFGRYGLLLLLGLWYLEESVWSVLVLCAVMAGFYSLWAILKLFRYVGKSWYWLPILQITADLAVMIGTIRGVLYSR